MFLIFLSPFYDFFQSSYLPFNDFFKSSYLPFHDFFNLPISLSMTYLIFLAPFPRLFQNPLPLLFSAVPNIIEYRRRKISNTNHHVFKYGFNLGNKRKIVIMEDNFYNSQTKYETEKNCRGIDKTSKIHILTNPSKNFQALTVDSVYFGS